METTKSIYLPQLAFYLIVGFATSWVLLVAVVRKSKALGSVRRGADFHHEQSTPIPRLGGVGIVGGFATVALLITSFVPINPSGPGTLIVIVLTTLVIFAVGLWDDLRPLGAKLKLALQVLVASAAYAGNVRIELLKVPFTDADIPLGIFGYFATVLWLVSLPNLINLIDGIDGLAGGISLMLMFLMATLGVQDNLGFSVILAVGVAGSLAAFLKFNYPPAKIYLGDGGAYFVGLLIGELSIINSNKGTIAAALIAPAFALALPIVDVSLAILRRGLRGLPLFRPDRRHIHHRLITLGISHEQTLLNLYTVSLLCLILAFGIFSLQGRLLPLYTGLLFLLLLVAGRLSGLTRNWSDLPGQLGASLRLRKQTRYALLLDQWFVLEAEKLGSLDDIWREYQFVVKKLGFSRVELIISGHRYGWRLPAETGSSIQPHYMIHELGAETSLEFFADKGALSETSFLLLSDLAAETWYKTQKYWQKSATSSVEAAAKEAKDSQLLGVQNPRPAIPETSPGHGA